MHSLPPLIALRAFEAVGRLGVADAARKLNVTRAAVLHQVRVLEAELGVALFVRSNRGLTLSPKGREYLAQVMESFDALSQNSRRLRETGDSRHLVIDSLTSFATEFIVPRLHRFYARHPNISLEIKTLTRWYGPLEFERTGANVAIRGGAIEANWPGLSAEKLSHEIHFPVCSPALLKGPDRLRTPADLARAQLIVATVAPEGWSGWIEAAQAAGHDMSGISFENTRRFDLMSMAMNVAAAGLGVDLGRSPLVDHHLAAGRLVAPFDIELVSKRAYWLICREQMADKPEFQAFRNWLLDELALLGRNLRPESGRSRPELALVERRRA